MNRTAGSILACLACGFSAGSDMDWPEYTCPRCAEVNLRLYRREHRCPRVAHRLTPGEIAAELKAVQPVAARVMHALAAEGRVTGNAVIGPVGGRR